MRVRMSKTVTAVTLLASVACASGGGSSGGGSTAGRSRPTADRNVILESEINSRAPDAGTALQVIQKLRPEMLRTRGTASPMDRTGESVQPKVYLDNIEYGTLSALTNVNASQISEIRFVNARDATTRWGTGHLGGVILIMTKR